ncbi:MAG: hypothetical protein FJ403_22240 [Verrucomicrobia bacterium]|nr:hypothetical protein [Verrucomicrobiota bacterium]
MEQKVVTLPGAVEWRIDSTAPSAFAGGMNWIGFAARAAAILLGLYDGAALAQSWSVGNGFRSLQVRPDSSGKPGFTLTEPATTGVRFTNVLKGDMYLTNAVAHNGAGVAIGDVDGDDWPDVYLCNLQGPNRLYRNLGQWRFEEANLGDAACADQLSTGATLADVDGDRDLDLLVNGIATGTRLFLNDGKGQWTESKDSGLSRTASPTSLALADIDGDGDLDLYCAHYIDVMHLADPTTRFALARRGDKWMVTKVNDQPATMPRWKDRFEALPDGKVRELPEVHGLYRNDGQGRFAEIQFEPGVYLDEEGKAIPPHRDWGLAVMFRDLNGDGAPDFYVCNDNASSDRLWINSGKGAFRAIDRSKLRHTSRSSMGVDFADIDRDGHDDFIVVDMLGREHEKRMTQLARDRPDPKSLEQMSERPEFNRNTLFLGRADGSYVEAALMAGLAATDWSWCPVFIDVDLDGYEDLLVTNGFSFDVMDQDSNDEFRRRRGLTQAQLKRSRQFNPAFPTRNAAFRNRRDGTFELMGHRWGFDQMGVSYGMALGDLDNDGDLDVVVNNLNAVASVYRNEAVAGRIAVRLKGLPPNTEGIGARVRLAGGAVTQSQEMICGGRYMSGDQAVRVFAADASLGKPLSLEVRWRDGTHAAITNVQPNRVYEVLQTAGPALAARPASAKAPRGDPIFVDVSAMLGHSHVEDSFDDAIKQPLLTRKLNRSGPGVSWHDVNGDGWEDLIIAAARGGKLAIYANEQGQKFSELERGSPAASDQGAVVGWPDGKGNQSLLVAMSNYEWPADRESEVAAYSLANFAPSEQLLDAKRWPAGKASLGPLAVTDSDGDGDLDVFVGGRFRPGRYPEPASSALWINEQGELRHNESLSAPFAPAGLVSGACFGDIDNDGDPDLILACDWGPLRIFLNEKGAFRNWDAPITVRKERLTPNPQLSTLNQLTGWWTSVATGDFDGDGKLDMAAGNWGRNSIYELYQPLPIRAFYGDWNGDGRIELIEAWQRGDHWLPVHDRTWLTRGLSELPHRFTTHQAFGKASIQEILGTRYQNAGIAEVASLESAVFLNRGDRFECLPLPREAQLSPVFSVNVGDFDADGAEDLFLSQNFFGGVSDMTRDDAGRGLWLRGKGEGTFTAVDASVTGIKIDGEQRGGALADFNHDGRVDLAVSQNNAATKLYLNQHGKRGLRVVCRGSLANPNAIGVQLRLVYSNDRRGPCRTIQAGSGYWSQNAAAQVLGLAEAPIGLWIRWPNGKEKIIALKDNVWDVHVLEDEPK